MSIIPFQSRFDKDFPIVIGNAEYNAECELTTTPKRGGLCWVTLKGSICSKAYLVPPSYRFATGA